MKIAFIGPSLKLSGGVRIALEYASRLSRRGHDVTVYVQSNNPLRRTIANTFNLGYPKWITDFDAKVIRVGEYSSSTIPNADVLIATTYKTALALGDFPKEKGRQFYLLQHDEGLYHGGREDADHAYRLPQKKIVVATWLQELLSEKYDQNAALLLNPYDKKLFHPEERVINDGTIRILILHHTYDWKGTKEGVAIIQELKETHPNVRLIMYGARQEENIEYPYDEYHYNLPQERLAWLYSNCDIFVCPSWDEGYGLPSVEAMACGVALATYDNGGSRDFAHDGETALVAPHRDTSALKEKLKQLIEDEGLRKRIAKGGYEYVSAMGGWDTRTKELEQILINS